MGAQTFNFDRMGQSNAKASSSTTAVRPVVLILGAGYAGVTLARLHTTRRRARVLSTLSRGGAGSRAEELCE